MTNHPINNKNVFDVSVTPRWVIWAKERRILTTGSDVGPREVFLTSWIFPDLPIAFCENQYLQRLYPHIDNREFMPEFQFSKPLRSGPSRKFFGYLHWNRNWWRHSYESWFSYSEVESLNDLVCHKDKKSMPYRYSNLFTSDFIISFIFNRISLWVRYP